MISSVEIKRTATAEYVLPLPMGSPENAFGNVQYAAYAGKPNFFAAISAPYTKRSQGDNIATKCINSVSAAACSGPGNPVYDPDGYFYAVEVPTGATNVNVEVFDAGFQSRATPLVESGDYAYGVPPVGTNGVNTQFTLHETDATPLTHLDNPVMTSGSCTTGTPDLTIGATAPVGLNGWTTLCNLATPAAGIYPLQVKSSNISGFSDHGYATNHFSIRAEANGGTGPQPRVYGIGRMSIFAEADAGSTEFFLADIQPIHAGKSLRVELFDPGESTSAADLTIVGPGGSPVDCVVSVDSGAPTTYSPCTIQTTDASGTALFNGSRLTIDFSLPLGYTCAADCWWKVQYNYTAAAHDRTTWTASILGDPVHLIRADGTTSP